RTAGARTTTRWATGTFGALEATHIRSLGDHLAALDGLEQLGAARGRRQVELGVQRVELEHVVVIADARRRAHAHVGIVADAAADYRSLGQLAFFDGHGTAADRDVPHHPVQHV